MDRHDLKRRASQQASYGNYWAGKTLSLLNHIEQLEIELQMMHDMAVTEADEMAMVGTDEEG